MSHLTIVVAMDSRRGIGINNQLPWHLPADLAHFKAVTVGKAIIMGRKTFESIGRPLPKRRNIVVTRNLEWKHDGVEVAHSLQEAIALLNGESASIIGGAEIYKEALPYTDQLIITCIYSSFQCDAHFPQLDYADWKEHTRDHIDTDPRFDYAFITYRRNRRRK